MTTERLTRCPHCKAAFKVSESQLSIANGRVRCGACMNVFDALAYTLGDAKQSATNEHPPEEESQAFTPEATVQDNELFQDNPDEDKGDELYSGTSSVDDEFSTSFLSLDDQNDNTSGQDHYQSELTDPEDSTDESWATDILENERIQPTGKTEPQISEIPLQEETSAADYELPNYDIPSNNEHIGFYYEEEGVKSRHWFSSTLLISVNLILIALLLIIASWFHYEKLVKYPQIASLYTKACELLDCQLPELSDITKIRSHNLIVRSHPTATQALIIDAVMVNDADYGQAFPNLALYFSDINNQTVAQRLIEPEHYLSPDILAWPEMPSQQPIHISIEIADPGKEAVNYTLKFFPVTPNK